jgi:hypothetical protein
MVSVLMAPVCATGRNTARRERRQFGMAMRIAGR